MDPPAGFIYLRTSPETCYQRLKKRARSEETGISIDYLRALHQKHEDWLLHKAQAPVLILDCDPDFEYNALRQAELIQQITDAFGPVLQRVPEFLPHSLIQEPALL